VEDYILRIARSPRAIIKDSEKYTQYIDRVSPIVEKYGGRYYVRGEKIRSLGDWKPERGIVIEFQNEDQIQRWLTSSEYADVAPLREEAADAKSDRLLGAADEVVLSEFVQ
jgi:uncharacterized protein (DUF1330 family)